MIVVVARCPVKPEKVEEFLDAARPLVAATREEEANASYQLVRGEQENELAFVERWEDQPGLDRHMASEHFTAAMAAVEPLLTRPMDVEIYQTVL